MNSKTPHTNTQQSKILFIASILISAYWLYGNFFSTRESMFQALHELLWIVFLPDLFVVPIIAIVLLVKQEFHFKSLNLCAALIPLSTWLFLMLTHGAG